MTVYELLDRNTPIGQILAHPEVEERCRRLAAEDTELHAALLAHSRVEGNVVVTDFRGLDPVPVGNRFLVFALFPKAAVALRVQRDPSHPHLMLTLGRNILHHECSANLGELAARYGGGGHEGAASIQLDGDADQLLERIVADLAATG